MNNRKAPDKYKCLKLPLKNILYPNSRFKIDSVVSNVNHLTYNTYSILRLWVLQLYHADKEIPEIDEHLVHLCMRVSSTVARNPVRMDHAFFIQFNAFYSNI